MWIVPVTCITCNKACSILSEPGMHCRSYDNRILSFVELSRIFYSPVRVAASPDTAWPRLPRDLCLMDRIHPCLLRRDHLIHRSSFLSPLVCLTQQLAMHSTHRPLQSCTHPTPPVPWLLNPPARRVLTRPAMHNVCSRLHSHTRAQSLSLVPSFPSLQHTTQRIHLLAHSPDPLIPSFLSHSLPSPSPPASRVIASRPNQHHRHSVASYRPSIQSDIRP